MLPCMHSNHVELKYYYDDDWGVRGSKVWYTDGEGNYREGTLCVCLTCGAVFVRFDDENDIK